VIPLISRLIIVGLAVLVYSSAHAQMDWTEVPDLSESDKANIVELVRNLGLPNPRHISVRTSLPLGDRVFVVRSEVFVDGLRRTWREAYICHTGDEFCSSSDKRVGSWGVSEESRRQERWRFSDGDWFVDVELGTGISYAEAETIIVAIRRNAIVKMPEAIEFKDHSEASNILSVGAIDPIAREFQVRVGDGGSGQILHVRLNGDEVQLLEVINWVAEGGLPKGKSTKLRSSLKQSSALNLLRLCLI
jgi:hypothetical protein